MEEGGLGGGAADGQLPIDQGESAEGLVLEGVARGETQRPGDVLSKEGPEGGRRSEDNTQVLSAEGEHHWRRCATGPWLLWRLPGAHHGQTPPEPQARGSPRQPQSAGWPPCFKEQTAGEKRRLVLTGRHPFALQLPNHDAVGEIRFV